MELPLWKQKPCLSRGPGILRDRTLHVCFSVKERGSGQQQQVHGKVLHARGLQCMWTSLIPAVRSTQRSLNEYGTIVFAIAVRMDVWATGQTSPLVLINYSEQHYFSVKAKTCLLWDLLYKYSWCRQLSLPAIHLSCLRRGISLWSDCRKQVLMLTLMAEILVLGYVCTSCSR